MKNQTKNAPKFLQLGTSVIASGASARIFAIGFAACLLTACSSTGDLRRVNNFDATSNYAPTQVGEIEVKPLNLSREEEDFQKRLQRFQDLESGGNWVADVSNMVKIASGRRLTEADYFAWLNRTYASSPEAAYNRILNHVEVDLLTVNQLFQAACSVQKVDERRQIAADGIASTPPETLIALQTRKAENQEDLQNLAAVMDFRYNSYSHALEQMLIQAPQETARAVDAKLSELAPYVQQAKLHNYCQSMGVVADTRPKSRFASEPIAL